MNKLPRPRASLLCHRLDDQTMVYDPRDESVHLLDATTGCVLEILREGGWSAERLAGEVARRQKRASSEALVSLALDELRKADLFEEDSAVPLPVSDLRRREMLKKVGLVGASALLIPAIATLTASSGYAATCLPSGATCTSGAQCCSGLCVAGSCV